MGAYSRIFLKQDIHCTIIFQSIIEFHVKPSQRASKEEVVEI